MQSDRRPRGTIKRGFVTVVKEDMKVAGARKEDTEDKDKENWFHCVDCREEQLKIEEQLELKCNKVRWLPFAKCQTIHTNIESIV